MDEKEQKKGDLSKTDFVLMLCVAIFFDVVLAAIQLIPAIGSVAADVFDVIPDMIFGIWFFLKGTTKKKGFWTSFGIASFIEYIPILNILPAWTAEVIYVYSQQKQDVILAKAAGVVGGAALGAGLFLNEDKKQKNVG